MLSVSLFGSLRLRLDGKEIRLAGRPKVVPLFAYIVLKCREPVARDVVAYALWPDESETTARTNLRRHLKYLRDALPPREIPWILADGRTVGWNPAVALRTDTEEFERCCNDPVRMPAAVDLYAELLPGAYDEWLVAAREQFHRAYVSALWELALQARGRRDLPAATEYLERILADDPWREDALRALMAVCCEAGDRSSALRLCAQFEQRLREEMNVALMSETTALRRAVEHNEPLPTVHAAPAALSRKQQSSAELAFGGREAEMGRLWDAWEGVVGGRGAFALIFGEAGIGKTRLASEFALRIEGSARVLWGTTSLPERAPYQAVTEVLRSAFGFIDAIPLPIQDRSLLSLLLPEALPEAHGDSLRHSEPAKLFDVVAQALRNVARGRPLLVVLEDLHNAGPATLAMLEHLVARCRGDSVFILATARSTEADNAVAFARMRRLRGGIEPLVISLRPLSEDAAVAVATGSKAIFRGTTDDARRFAAMAAGNPLFLAELVFASAESGAVAGDALSPRLRDVIAARLERLSPESRLLLNAASVVGNSFDLEVVGDVVGWSEAELAEAADELVARRVIREMQHGAVFEFQFAHDLVAVAAYESLADRERRRWHRRTARAGTRWYASRLDELAPVLARHFELGGEPAAAAAQYLRAARAAEAAFANDEALAYARRALELGSESNELRFDVLALREAVSERVGDRAEQRIALDQLDPVARELGDRERIMEVLRRRESLHRYFGEFAMARDAIAELHRIAGGSARWEAIALRDEAAMLVDGGSRSMAYERVVAAAARAAAAGDDDVVVSTVTLQAHVAALLGRREEARAALAQAKDASDRSGSPLLRMRTAYCEMSTFLLFQEYANVTRAAPALFELAEKVGNREMRAGAHAMVGGAFAQLFEVALARHHLDCAVELYRASDVNGAAIAYNNLATLELDVGRLDRVDRVVREMHEVVADSEAVTSAEYVRLVECEVALRRKNYTSASTLAEGIVESADRRSDPLLEGEGLRCLGTAFAALGRTKEAVAALERAVERLQAIGAGGSGVRARVELARACALAGDVRAASFADDALRSIVEERAATPPSAFWALAQAFEAAGRAGDARDALARGREAFAAQSGRLRSAADRAAFAALPGNADVLSAFSEGGSRAM